MAIQPVIDTTKGSFNTFGELLKHLRLRAQLTQQALGTAVGSSYAQIARLESGSRLPDPAVVRARFIEALDLAHAPDLAQSLLGLAERAHQAGEVPQTSPTKATSHRPPTNLFTRLTRFVGRERDLAEVQRLIAANCLVTLTGAGGVGKTRLAVEAAERALDAYPDGVWLVELAPLTDETLVARAIATTFRLPDDLGRPKLQLLTEHIGSKHMLIVLDNCEHVIAASADAAETLLRACPNLSILATSRETLRISGEVAWRVPSLDTGEAIQLFELRAREAIPETALTEHPTKTIAKICNRLDGIPLAIELAASRLRVYSLEMIAERLDDRFRLLTGGSRTALPRHQTLWALIDWSYNLLTSEEQQLLGWLSVFAGGWTLQGAEALGEGLDVVNLLPQLVDKSLVSVIDRAGDRRFFMLETVRQYGTERLKERRHLDLAFERLNKYLITSQRRLALMNMALVRHIGDKSKLS